MANYQTVYHSDSSINAIIKAELTDAREEFLTLLASLSNIDLKRKSNVSVWTSKELLVHIVFWLQQTPRAVTLVRTGKRLPRLPGVLFAWINIWLTRLAAWRQDRDSIIEQYERAFQCVMQLTEEINEQEWQQGIVFGAPFYEYRTIEQIIRSHCKHVREHAREIRQSS